jgi:hypothetical protein
MIFMGFMADGELIASVTDIPNILLFDSESGCPILQLVPDPKRAAGPILSVPAKAKKFMTI